MNQTAEVIAIRDEIVGEPCQQLRMDGRIATVHLIGRIDETSPQKSGPRSIDNILREKMFLAVA